jgi:hypothetical protein
MSSKAKREKLVAARAAAALPLRLAVAEFALLKLRQSFVKAQVTRSPSRCTRSVNRVAGADASSQSLVSVALAELFKKKFSHPDWFEKLKDSAGKGMRDFIKDEHGPWDMCAEILRLVSARSDARCSYTVFSILQKEFTEVVMPGLALVGADSDDIRFRLECLVADVLVTRNWVAHNTLSVQEVKRGMQSLLDILPLLHCDTSLLPSVRIAIEEHMREVDNASAPGASSELCIGSVARLFFMRNSQRLCTAVGEPHEVDKAIGRMAKGDKLMELQKGVVVKIRHDLHHGKSDEKSLCVIVALCALSHLLRSLSSAHAFPHVIDAAADACDDDVMHLLALMQLCDEDELLQAVSLGHQAA